MKEWNPENIKNFRERLNVSQTAFGKLIGVSRNNVYYLERGERMPSKTLMLLLDCLDEKEKKKGGRKNATRSL